MRPDSSCSPGVFKSSVDAELGASGAASELSGTLVWELDVCAVVICWAKEVEQRWWWWWWHHLETMPRQTHLRARIISHSPLPAFQGFPAASWLDVLMFCLQCKDTDSGAVNYSLFSFNACQWSGVLSSDPLQEMLKSFCVPDLFHSHAHFLLSAHSPHMLLCICFYLFQQRRVQSGFSCVCRLDLT